MREDPRGEGEGLVFKRLNHYRYYSGDDGLTYSSRSINYYILFVVGVELSQN
jgi:hypothetical protein